MTKKISVLVALITLAAVALTIFYGLSGSAPVSFSGDDEPAHAGSDSIWDDAVNAGEHDDNAEGQDGSDEADIHESPNGEPEVPEDPEEPEEEDEYPEEPEEDILITLLMEPSDIFKGSLLLINHNHRYDIPGDADLVIIEEHMTTSYRVEREGMMVCRSIIGPLNEMMDAFYEEKGRATVTIISAFRGYERQRELLDEYTELMGRTEALRWAARPGHSEHHAGLAVDFGVLAGGSVRTFQGIGSVYSWFNYNAHRFGFILRYTEEKTRITGVAHEPWHFRFIGMPHSYIMFENGLCLEEYIDFIKEYGPENSYIADYDGVMYEIFFTRELEITVPENRDVTISGNNIDGFVVTIERNS